MRQQSDELGRTAEEWMNESPFTVALTAMAVGAAAGFALPLSESEYRALGATRRTLIDVAKQTVLPTD
jgi:hypothetical protein